MVSPPALQSHLGVVWPNHVGAMMATIQTMTTPSGRCPQDTKPALMYHQAGHNLSWRY